MILKGTIFEIKVWKYLKTIKKGSVKTYKQVADGINRPKSARAVANACAKNPHFPIIIFLTMYLWSKLSENTKNRLLMIVFGIFLISIFILLFLLRN